MAPMGDAGWFQHGGTVSSNQFSVNGKEEGVREFSSVINIGKAVVCFY
jgi:hypothetical protein